MVSKIGRRVQATAALAEESPDSLPYCTTLIRLNELVMEYQSYSSPHLLSAFAVRVPLPDLALLLPKKKNNKRRWKCAFKKS